MSTFTALIKALKVRYMGQTKVGKERFLYFHDLQTNANFKVANMRDLEKQLYLHREKFYREHSPWQWCDRCKHFHGRGACALREGY